MKSHYKQVGHGMENRHMKTEKRSLHLTFLQALAVHIQKGNLNKLEEFHWELELVKLGLTTVSQIV